MDLKEVLWIIGVIYGVYNFLSNNYPKIYRFGVLLSLKQAVIANYIYLTILIVFSIVSIGLFLALPLAMNIFDAKWAVLLSIIMYSNILIWSPIVAEKNTKLSWVSNIPKFLNYIFPISLVIVYWILLGSNDITIPIILLAIVIIALVFQLSYFLIQKRKSST